MNPPTGDSASFDDDLDFLIAEECRAVFERGAKIDPEALAARLAADPARVRRVVLAVEAVRGDSVPFFAGSSAAETSRSEPAPPILPADYELGPLIGKGGMGVVYRARQKSLGRDVAVKVLRPGEMLFGDAIRRFKREAASLARLRHPHIVAIHDLGETNGQVFFAMDLIDGRPLSELLAAKRPMAPSAAVRLMRQTAAAIAYAHERGVIHRDLKPSNILVTKENDAFVVDFGLAVDVRQEGDATVSGRILGTPAYMAPEQARGDKKRIGERTDVHALGVLLYEMLGGKAPFAAPSLAETLAKILNDDPEPLRRVNAAVPAALAAIVHHAMAKDPEKRYPTARALLEDLDRFVEGREVRAKPEGLLARAWRGVMRRADVVGVALLTSLVVGGLFFWKTRPDPEQRWSEAQAVVESFAAAGKTQTAIDHLERSIDLAPGFLARDRAAARLFELRSERLGEAARLGDVPAVTSLAAAIVRYADEEMLGLNRADSDFAGRRRDLGLKRIYARAATASADELIADSDAFLAMSLDHEAPLILILLEAAEAYGVDGRRPFGHGVVAALARRLSVDFLGQSESVEAWCVEKAESRTAILAAIVREIVGNASPEGRTLAGPLFRSVRAVAGTPARRRLENELLAIAQSEDERRSPSGPRAFPAAALLADVVDAPARIREFTDELPSPSAEAHAEIFGRLEAGAKAVAGERHRLFADWAAELLASPRHRGLADSWLARRGADAAVRDANPRWLESFRLDDRPFLKRSLDLPDDLGAEAIGALVTRLAVSSEGDRARIHELLARIVAHPERAPHWSSRSGVPADLVEEWWAAAGGAADRDFVLRVALVHRDRDGTLRIIRSLTEETALFAPVELDWQLDYAPQCDGRLVRPFARAATRVGPYGPAFPVAYAFRATLALKGLGPRIVLQVNGREGLTFEVAPAAESFALTLHNPQFAAQMQRQLQRTLAPRRKGGVGSTSSSDLNDHFFRCEYVVLAALEPRREAPPRSWTIDEWRAWSLPNGLGVEPVDDLARPKYWKKTFSDGVVLLAFAILVLALLGGGAWAARRRSKLLAALLSSTSLAAGSAVLCVRFEGTLLAASAGAIGTLAIAAAFAFFPGVRVRRFDRFGAVFLTIAGIAQVLAAFSGPHSNAERAAGFFLASLVLLRSGQIALGFRGVVPGSRLFAGSMCLMSLLWGIDLGLSATGENFGWWTADATARWGSTLAFWLFEDLVGVLAVSIVPNVGDRFSDVEAYLAKRRSERGDGAPASTPVSGSAR